MIVELRTEWLKELKPGAASIKAMMNDSWSAKRHRIDLRMFTPGELEKLIEMTKTKKGPGYRVLLQDIETYQLMLVDPAGRIVQDLKELVMALTAHFEAKAPHKWVFTVQGNKRVPYFVREITYHPRRTETHGRGEDKWTQVHPAYVHMKLQAALGEGSTVTWREADIDGKRSVPKLLGMKGMITETPALLERYEAEVAVWRQVTEEHGRQFLATGEAHSVTSAWYSSSEIQMERDGKRARVVVDNSNEEDGDEDNGHRSRGRRHGRHNNSSVTTGNAEFWNKTKNMSKRVVGDDDDEESDTAKDEEDIIALPIHPWVTIFDLELHQYAQIHIGDLEPYPYDTTLHEKLVLPDRTA